MVADRRNTGSKPESPGARESIERKAAGATWSFHVSALSSQSKPDRSDSVAPAKGGKKFSIILWDEPDQRRGKRGPGKS
jgi:hypothetical protein